MKTTEENNKMIAEFMCVDKNENGTFELPQFGSIRPNGDFKTEFSVGQLKFHTSWDWLMPVVEKIESTFLINDNQGYKHQIQIWNNCCLVANGNNGEEIIREYSTTKLQATYNSVVQFIEWYNTNSFKKEEDV